MGEDPPPDGPVEASWSVRSRSFGLVAEEYARYRPGPSEEVADFVVPPGAEVLVELGAGTGGFTRLVTGIVPTVVATEPDEQMARVLRRSVPGCLAVRATAEAIPLFSEAADVVVAVSSWHWMSQPATLEEAARLLRDSGRLAVVWSGPDPAAPLRDGLDVERLMSATSGSSGTPREHASNWRVRARRHLLELPEGSKFEDVERREIRWLRQMSARQLVGLVGTYSRVILAEPGLRCQLDAQVSSYLERELGIKGEETTEVPYRALCWRARRLGRKPA